MSAPFQLPLSLRRRGYEPVVFAVCFSILLWSRLGSLTLGFWNDEAYTAAYYVDRGADEIFHGHYIPNNHILFSWLAWWTTSLFGRTEPIYRAWSVVPGILALIVLCGFTARWLGTTAAMACAFLGATSTVHLDLVPQARGYGLAMLGAAIMLIGALSASERPSARWPWVLFGCAAWIGISTLPVFVLPFGAHVVTLFAKPSTRRAAAITAFIVAFGVILFLGPVIPQIYAARVQHFGYLIDGWDLAWRPFADLLLPAYADRTLVAIVTIIAAVVFAAGEVGIFRTRGREALAHVTLPIILTYTSIWLLGLFVVPRFVSFLLVYMLIPLSCGVVHISAALERRFGRRVATRAGLFTAAVVLIWFCVLAREYHSYPIEAYRDVIEIIRRSGAEPFTNSTYWVGFDYYAPGLLKHPAPHEMSSLICDSDRLVAFVDYPLFSNHGKPNCLHEARATSVVVRQRAGWPAGAMVVWLIAPRSPGTE